MIRTASPLRFVPVGAVKIADKASDAVAFLYTDRDGHPCARVFYGKQSKPVLRCYYRTVAQREAAVVRTFEARRATAARKAEYKAARKAAIPTYAVDDVLSTCWGYDQTNREFYQVVKVAGAAVTVRQIAAETVATGDMTARVIPLPGDFIGAEMVRRPSGSSLRISECQRAYHHEFEAVAGVKVYRAVSTSSYA
jgi:hypothetical protein